MEHTEVTKDLETETKSCTTCTDRWLSMRYEPKRAKILHWDLHQTCTAPPRGRHLGLEWWRLMTVFLAGKTLFPGRKTGFSRLVRNADWLFERYLHHVSRPERLCSGRHLAQCRKAIGSVQEKSRKTAPNYLIINSQCRKCRNERQKTGERLTRIAVA